MRDAGRYLAQALIYAAFALLLAGFSSAPAYRHLAPGLGVVKLSFAHAGARVSECRRMSAEEVAALAPNMRRDLDCPRGRVPLHIEMDVDGELYFNASPAPSGLSGDGPSTVYARVPLAAGEHRIDLRMRDSRRPEGFDYIRTETVTLAPAQLIVIGFDKNKGGFHVLR